jgi:hypothetical protein
MLYIITTYLVVIRMNEDVVKPRREEGGKPGWLSIVQQQVESLRYGEVQIVVHDSRVTQIEKTERVRLDKSPEPKI